MMLKLYVFVYRSPFQPHLTTRTIRVEALTSCMTPEYLKEKEEDVKNLAKRIEDDLYHKANSKDEYYAILAKKIFKLNQAAQSGTQL